MKRLMQKAKGWILNGLIIAVTYLNLASQWMLNRLIITVTYFALVSQYIKVAIMFVLAYFIRKEAGLFSMIGFLMLWVAIERRSPKYHSH